MTSPIGASNWTLKEEAYLKRVWGTRTKQEIATTLERSIGSVEGKVRRMGLDKPATKAAAKPAPKIAPKPAPKPAPKAYTAAQTDVILHKATASRIPTIDEAEAELREAIEKCCHATANHPLTKQRCQMLLMAWNVLDLMEKF